MNEYEIKIKAIKPGFFSNDNFTGISIYESNSAQEAKEKCEREIRNNLTFMELQDQGGRIEIISIKKI